MPLGMSCLGKRKRLRVDSIIALRRRKMGGMYYIPNILQKREFIHIFMIAQGISCKDLRLGELLEAVGKNTPN